MCIMLFKMYIVVMGMECIVFMFVEVDVLIIMLVCSVVGVCLMGYNIWLIGLCEVGYVDGFEEFYLVIVDNGCFEVLVFEFWDVLCCICCGVCMNICLVYCYIGGYGYGFIYSGLIGVVIFLLFGGYKDFKDLFYVCFLCIVCDNVCLVCILLLKLILCYCWVMVEKGIIVKVE